MNDIAGLKIVESSQAVDKALIIDGGLSEYDIYRLLEDNGYIPSERNKNILIEGLATGKYSIFDELSEMLFDEFENWSESEALNESGSFKNARWRFAMFSLRFLKESSIDDFFMIYYADDDGNPTDEGRNYCKNTSKRNKVKRLRELAERLSDDEKRYIINSPAVAQADGYRLSGIWNTHVGALDATVGCATGTAFTAAALAGAVATTAGTVMIALALGISAGVIGYSAYYVGKGIRQLRKAQVMSREEIIKALKAKRAGEPIVKSDPSVKRYSPDAIARLKKKEA